MSRHKFLSNDTRAKVATAALACILVCYLAHIALFAWLLPQIGVLEDSTTADQIETAILLALFASVLCCIISFLFWFRRAYGNAFAAGLRSTVSPGWAVGAWFVPFLNLVRPYQIAASMWRQATPHLFGRAPIVGLWWTCLLAGRFGENVGSRLMNRSESVDEVIGAFQVVIIGDALLAVAASLAIVMVRRLTTAQSDLHLATQAEAFE